MNRFEVGQKAAIERVADEPLQLRFVEMNAMAEQRARAQKAVAVVDVGVARSGRIEPAGGRDLVVIFREVGLDVAVGMLAHERTRGFQLRLGRGQGKAWADRVELAPLPVPAADQRLGLVVATLGRVEQARRRAAVHHHLACDHPRIALVALGEERLGRFRVHAAIDHGRGGAVAQELVHEEASDPPRVVGLGELLLLDEGVFLQPLQKLGAVGGDHLGLREVQVRVDQSRQHELVRIVVDRRSRRQGRQESRGLAHLGDGSALDHDQPVRQVAVAGGGPTSAGSPVKVSTRPRTAWRWVMKATRPWRRRPPRRPGPAAPRA